MAKKLRILGIHGIGLHDRDDAWQAKWVAAAEASAAGSGCELSFEWVLYDELFRKEDLTALDVAHALGRLLTSGIVHGIGDLFSRSMRDPTARGRWVQGMSDKVRWTAGMVVQWAENDDLRAKVRARIAEAIREVQPDVVLAHSLGSLVAYDTLVREPALGEGRVFVSLGSQIGNPFVRGTFAGRIAYPRGLSRWFHLYNRYDDVFTAALSVPDPEGRFEQILTPFDLEGIGDHDAEAYLEHESTRMLWGSLAGDARRNAARGAFQALIEKPDHRALLIGIDAYPNAEDRLEGCVNDVFLMSATLQESGFEPGQIRVVLNERATAEAIRARLQWLLEGAKDQDRRLLYFSGHGAQMPGYGASEEVDRLDEVLVPYDFDWTAATAITDDDLAELYTQLPYGVSFAAVFDCCHSGGLTRSGSNRVRGLDPPDDIRHRALQWDPVHEAWVPRALEGAANLRKYDDFLGQTRATSRLGAGVALRTLDDRTYDEERRNLEHYGPYMPLIVQACQEEQFSYEYRHGVTSYGAFTYAFTTILRRHRHRSERPSFAEVVEEAAQMLTALGYDQRPKLDGPKFRKEAPIPYELKPIAPVQDARLRASRLMGDAGAESDAGDIAAAELYALLLEEPAALDETEGPRAKRADQHGSMRDTFRERFGIDWDADVAKPGSLADLKHLLEQALAEGRSLRLVGAARSMSTASDPQPMGRGEVLPVSLIALGSEVPYSTANAWKHPDHRAGRFVTARGARDRLYRCEAGRSAKGVIDDIRRSGRSLGNHGSGWFQGIVGALATGTHGSGAKLPPLAGLVRALTVLVPVSDTDVELQLLMPADDRRPYRFPASVLNHEGGRSWIHGPGGEKTWVIADTERFDAALVGLGCLGVVYAVTFEVEPRKLHLHEERELWSWKALTRGGHLEDLVQHGVERHLEVQICPHHGHGEADGAKIAPLDHLVQLVRRTEADAPVIPTPPHPLVQLGRIEGVAPGQIGRRVRKGLKDPTSLPDSLICSLTATSKWPRTAYIADILLLNLKYEGLGAEFAVPLSSAVAAANDILAIARAHDAAGAAAGSQAARVKVWRETPPLTAVVTMRFTAPDRALLSMAHGGTEPWCVFEVGMLGSPGLNKALRDGDTSGDADELALYRAYLEGRKRLFAKLERTLAVYGARPHWGLYNRLTGGRAKAGWGGAWDRWLVHYQAANRGGVFDNRFTDQLGISTRPGLASSVGRVALRRRNGKLFLDIEGALGWALFHGMPSGPYSTAVRKGVHVLATDRTWLPVVAEIRWDEQGALLGPHPSGRPTIWGFSPVFGQATYDRGSGVLTIGGPAGTQLAAELHQRQGDPGAAPGTVRLKVVDLAKGELQPL